MPIYEFETFEGDRTKEVYIPLEEFVEECLLEIEGEVRDCRLRISCAVHDWGHNQEGTYIMNASHSGETFPDKASWKRYQREHGLREMDGYD